MRLGIMCRIQYWLLVDGVTHCWLQYCWLWDRPPMSGMRWLLVGNISIYLLRRRLDDSSVCWIRIFIDWEYTAARIGWTRVHTWCDIICQWQWQLWMRVCSCWIYPLVVAMISNFMLVSYMIGVVVAKFDWCEMRFSGVFMIAMIIAS